MWQEYIQSIHKKEMKGYFEEFYHQLELLIDCMDLPFCETPKKK